MICVELANDIGSTSILLDDPFLRARSRIISDWLNKEVCSQFYPILVSKDEEKRKSSFLKLTEGLNRFQNDCLGPFFYGEKISMVDIAVFPWMYRIFGCNILTYFRGDEYFINLEDAQWKKLKIW